MRTANRSALTVSAFLLSFVVLFVSGCSGGGTGGGGNNNNGGRPAYSPVSILSPAKASVTSSLPVSIRISMGSNPVGTPLTVTLDGEDISNLFTFSNGVASATVTDLTKVVVGDNRLIATPGTSQTTTKTSLLRAADATASATSDSANFTFDPDSQAFAGAVLEKSTVPVQTQVATTDANCRPAH